MRLLILLDAGARTDVQDVLLRAPPYCAVSARNADSVEFLLAKGADVNFKNGMGKTALHLAVLSEDDEEMINDNIRRSQPRQVMTALQITSSLGNLYLVQILLTVGADVNAPPAPPPKGTELGMTALQAAASHPEGVQVARVFVEHGADMNAGANSDRPSALVCALKKPSLTLVHMLINARADVNAGPDSPRWPGGYLTTALVAAIYWGDHSIIHLLLQAGADVNNQSAKITGKTALRAAAKNNGIELARYLVDISADANNSGALLAAVEGIANLELVQFLLYRITGHGEKEYGCTALQAATESKDFRTINILLDFGLDLNTLVQQQVLPTTDETALGTAITTDIELHLSLVRLLLKRGGDPNSVVRCERRLIMCECIIECVHRQGRTALVAAVTSNNISLVQLFIEAGADVNAPATNDVARNALQAAVEVGNLELVRILLRAGANVNAPPAAMYGVTALQAAAIGGYVGIARILLENGADVSAEPSEYEGRTALEGAAEHGRIDMLQLLLNAGAQSKVAAKHSMLELWSLPQLRAIMLHEDFLKHTMAASRQQPTGKTPREIRS